MPFAPLIQAVTKYWLLFVKRAAAYLGFNPNALLKVTKMSSKELSRSPRVLSESSFNKSTPSFTVFSFLNLLFLRVCYSSEDFSDILATEFSINSSFF